MIPYREKITEVTYVCMRTSLSGTGKMSKAAKAAQTARGKRSLDGAEEAAVPSSKIPRAGGGSSWKQGQICRLRLHNFL